MLITEESIKNLMDEIILLEQQEEGDYYQYTGNPEIHLTTGFNETFGKIATNLAMAAVMKVRQELDRPEYQQVCIYQGMEFLLCDHKEYGGLVAMLPEEW